MKKRLRLLYSGSVHGVGFRWTAQRVAASLTLTGWVRNLPDGGVEAVCEGEEAQLVEFIKKMNEGPMRHYIRDLEADWQDATGEFLHFNIK